MIIKLAQIRKRAKFESDSYDITTFRRGGIVNKSEFPLTLDNVSEY